MFVYWDIMVFYIVQYEDDEEPCPHSPTQTYFNNELWSHLETCTLVTLNPFQLDDSDLDIIEEPETWSDKVDKKVQRKMHAKDIKRQDVIYGKMLM